jgi:hypothetical protein
MRWILPLVVASVALLSSPAAASWVRVKTEPDNDIYSVDVDLIEGRGRFRYFWSNIIFGKPNNTEAGQLAYSAVYYLSVDCQDKLYRLRFKQLLDENNKTIQEYNYGEDAGLVAPNPGSSEKPQ